MTTITFVEAARRLEIALPTAYRFAHAGRFPVPLEGSAPWHVQAADIDAFLPGTPVMGSAPFWAHLSGLNLRRSLHSWLPIVT